MTKWKCSKSDCMKSPCILETRAIPHICPFLNLTTPEWEKQEEPATAATTTDTLPKLTAEVFDRPDCPKWAEYAAVDKNGHVFVFDLEPECTHSSWYKITRFGSRLELGGVFDSSDYEHSLIRKMKQKQEENPLPDWCKVGEWVYAICYFSGDSDYSKIREIKPGADTILEIEGHGADYLVWGNHIKQARLRPYNAEELKALVGKVIESKDKVDCLLVTAYNSGEELDDVAAVMTLGEWVNAEDLLRVGYTIDGAPCGKFEHLEDGEWVK